MIFSLQNIIFNFFSPRDVVDDINKVNGKGFLQRFNEALAADLDANEIALLNNLIDNCYTPLSCNVAFIDYRIRTFGGPIYLSNNTSIKRKLIWFIPHINQRRGTKSGYLTLFRLLGFSGATFTEIDNQSGFDNSTLTFDDPNRVFDQKCKSCSAYTIDITGTITLTPDLIKGIEGIIEYNEPINADLISLTYNGTPVTLTGSFSNDFNNDFY